MPPRRRGSVSSRCLLLEPMGYHAAATRAARRSAGPPSPPTQIGGGGRCPRLGAETKVFDFFFPAGKSGGPPLPHKAEGARVFIGPRAALGERRRDDGIELGLQPARADAHHQSPA